MANIITVKLKKNWKHGAPSLGKTIIYGGRSFSVNLDDPEVKRDFDFYSDKGAFENSPKSDVQSPRSEEKPEVKVEQKTEPKSEPKTDAKSDVKTEPEPKKEAKTESPEPKNMLDEILQNFSGDQAQVADDKKPASPTTAPNEPKTKEGKNKR